MTDAPDTPENSADIVWVDTAERDRRLDLVDQILGIGEGNDRAYGCSILRSASRLAWRAERA